MNRPLLDISREDKISYFFKMLEGTPYHCAVLEKSMNRAGSLLQKIRQFPGPVYASFGQWGTIALHVPEASKWILDQQNADVDFWRVYARQVGNPLKRLAALWNWNIAGPYFRKIYKRLGWIVAVCEEDKQLTLSQEPEARVAVVPNGVECDLFRPDRSWRQHARRVLFSGTSAPRNVTALKHFTSSIWPEILKSVPGLELLVAGNFSAEAQAKFRDCPNIRFTGPVPDIRPYFNKSDLFLAPFQETHGSKLKVAEAMAMAMPIVSYAAGVRGFDLQAGTSVLLAENSGDFAKKTIDLLKNPEGRKTLGENARRTARETLDWPVLGEKVRDLILQISQGRRLKS